MRYKDTVVGEYYVDVLVENRVVVELKAQSRLGPADETPLLNYLKASGLRVGMLVNFAYPKAQIRRLVSWTTINIPWVPWIPWPCHPAFDTGKGGLGIGVEVLKAFGDIGWGP